MKGVMRFARAAAEMSASMAYHKSPPVIVFAHWPTLARHISEGKEPMWSVLYDSLEADLLLLDDIGAESDKYKTGETTDGLCQLLTARADKWTVITTNIERIEWSTHFDSRVADRLQRNAEVVEMSAGSYAVNSDNAGNEI
jgi:DNA replication protein DnaC